MYILLCIISFTWSDEITIRFFLFKFFVINTNARFSCIFRDNSSYAAKSKFSVLNFAWATMIIFRMRKNLSLKNEINKVNKKYLKVKSISCSFSLQCIVLSSLQTLQNITNLQIYCFDIMDLSESCSFQAIVGGQCGCDAKDRNKSTGIIALKDGTRDIHEHKRYFSITGVETEIELILARACIFESPRGMDSFKICPRHRAILGVSWKRGSAKCCIPTILSKHSVDVKKRPKAERSMSKSGSKTVLKETGVFLAVGSGKLILRLYDDFLCNYLEIINLIT